MKMEQIELEVPESTIKKIKAWNLLKNGGGNANQDLVQILDEALSREIVASLGINTHTEPVHHQPFIQAVAVPPAPPAKFTPTVAPVPETGAADPIARPDGLMEYDNSASLELGDDYDEEDEEDLGEEAFVPSYGGLSEDSLARDMEVEDPEHEAVSEGVRDIPSSSPEDMFSSSLNLPQVPQVDPGVLRREQLKRKSKSKRRAKVSSYGGPV